MNPYLVINLAFLLIWGLIFWKAKHFRKPMLIFSLIVAAIGPISEYWYLKDYWQPDFSLKFPIGGLEDILFGFAIGGIAGFGYEALFVKQICLCQRDKLKKNWFLLVFAGIEITAMVILNSLLGINSIYASAAGMIITAAILLIFRPDLWLEAVGSAILVALAMFLVYLIPQLITVEGHRTLTRYWLLYDRSGSVLLFGHVPLTEMIWGLSWGLVWGPMYEFLTGARIYTLKR